MQNDDGDNGELKREKSTIGESFKTQTAAEIFVKTLLPFDWLWREEKPDFFVDFHVEVGEEGEPSGVEFRVQIKGTASKNFRLRRQMKCKHLKYYRDKARLPVFVILVDLIGKKAYWLFAQRYLRECVNKNAVNNQETFTLCFDPVDSLQDLQRFREAVKNAECYMRELYPSSAAAAVSAKQAELQQLDPDIEVKVSFDEGDIIHFKSEKPLHYTFTGLNNEGFKSFQAMLDHGDDFEGPAEVTPPESPLFQKLMPGKNGYFEFKPHRPDGYMQIVVPASQHVVHIDGKWRVGRKSIRFEGKLEKSPLQVELRIEDWLEGANSKTKFDTPISLAEWEGQSILQLAWFDAVQSFVSALANREEFIVRYFVSGANVGEMTAFHDKDASTASAAAGVNDLVNWLANVRRIALQYGINPVLPEWNDITPGVRHAVEILDTLTQGKSREQGIAGQRFPFSASNEAAFLRKEPFPPGTVKLIGLAVFNLLGAEITVPNVEELYVNVRVVRTNTVNTTGKKVFEIVGEDDAVLITRKIAA